MNKYQILFLLGLSLFGASIAQAATLALPVIATIPAELDTLLTDVGTTWTTVKTLILGFLAFGIIVGVVMKVKTKKNT